MTFEVREKGKSVRKASLTNVTDTKTNKLLLM